MDVHPGCAAAAFVGRPARNLVPPGGQLGIAQAFYLLRSAFLKGRVIVSE